MNQSINKSSATSVSPEKYSELSFIFTSHSMLPNAEDELEAILKAENPDTLFVEISPENLRRKRLEAYPLEMVFALKWGERHSRQVLGFDCDVDTKLESVSEEIRKANIARYLEYRKGRSWRDLNDPVVASYGISIAQANHDPEKLNRRRSCMKQNIMKLLPTSKRALVLTGGFHSEYFRTGFKKARFPLTPEH